MAAAWFDPRSDGDVYYAADHNSMVAALVSGNADDAIITADGTDGHKIQGSGKTFETAVTDDDTKVPTSGAVVDYAAPKTISDYIQLNPLGCIMPATDSAGINFDETTTNKNNYVYGNYTRAGDGTNRLQWKHTLTEDWDTGGTISLKLHWTVKTGTAGHKIKWQLYCKQLADGESLDTALVSLGTVEDAIIGNEYLHITTAVTPAAISGAAGSEVIFEIRRIASAATETSSDGRYLDGSVKYTRALA